MNRGGAGAREGENGKGNVPKHAEVRVRSTETGANGQGEGSGGGDGEVTTSLLANTNHLQREVVSGARRIWGTIKSASAHTVRNTIVKLSNMHQMENCK